MMKKLKEMYLCKSDEFGRTVTYIKKTAFNMKFEIGDDSIQFVTKFEKMINKLKIGEDKVIQKDFITHFQMTVAVRCESVVSYFNALTRKQQTSHNLKLRFLSKVKNESERVKEKYDTSFLFRKSNSHSDNNYNRSKQSHHYRVIKIIRDLNFI